MHHVLELLDNTMRLFYPYFQGKDRIVEKKLKSGDSTLYLNGADTCCHLSYQPTKSKIFICFHKSHLNSPKINNFDFLVIEHRIFEKESEVNYIYKTLWTTEGKNYLISHYGFFGVLEKHDISPKTFEENLTKFWLELV